MWIHFVPRSWADQGNGERLLGGPTRRPPTIDARGDQRIARRIICVHVSRAEGIEREEQIWVLSVLGVRYGQGHRLARPRPLSEQHLVSHGRRS